MNKNYKIQLSWKHCESRKWKGFQRKNCCYSGPFLLHLAWTAVNSITPKIYDPRFAVDRANDRQVLMVIGNHDAMWFTDVISCPNCANSLGNCEHLLCISVWRHKGPVTEIRRSKISSNHLHNQVTFRFTYVLITFFICVRGQCGVHAKHAYFSN